jgi:methyltransferase-like protein
MNNTPGYIKRIEENIVWTKLDDTAIIILTNENEEKVFNLNKTAAYVWENCDGTKTLEDMVRLLCERFNVDEITARKDTEEFVALMEKNQLISLTCGVV